MTEIKFHCPHCDQPLEAPSDLFGQTIDCPTCDRSIQVPKGTPDLHSAHRRAHLGADSHLWLQRGVVALGRHAHEAEYLPL